MNDEATIMVLLSLLGVAVALPVAMLLAKFLIKHCPCAACKSLKR